MRWLALIAFVGLNSLASAQITKSPQGYLFRMKHQAGAIFKYAVVSTLSGATETGKPMKFNLPMTWKVLGVKNGVATIDTTVGPVSMGGSPMMQPTKTRIQMDARGRMVGQAGVGQQVTPSLPEKPIKVGQSWSASAPIELPMQGDKKVNATYTFKGFKTVNGKQMAELSIKTAGQATGSGTMLLQASDGSVFRSTLRLNLAVTNPNGGASKYKVTAEISRK
jgi:hypothetical protein